MKSITLAGRLGRDAVSRNTPDNKPVLNFTVAVTDGYGETKSTMWFDCALWGDRGSKLAQYLTKGTQVCVTGDLGRREHDGKTYLMVRVSDVTLMGGGEKSGESEQRVAGKAAIDLDDEIPF